MHDTSYDEPTEAGMKNYVRGHKGEERELLLKDVYSKVITYLNSKSDMESFIDKCEKSIDKRFTNMIRKLEADIQVYDNENEKEIDMQGLTLLRGSAGAITQAFQALVSIYNNEYEKASAIALHATDLYIKEMTK